MVESGFANSAFANSAWELVESGFANIAFANIAVWVHGSVIYASVNYPLTLLCIFSYSHISVSIFGLTDADNRVTENAIIILLCKVKIALSNHVWPRNGCLWSPSRHYSL